METSVGFSSKTGGSVWEKNDTELVMDSFVLLNKPLLKATFLHNGESNGQTMDLSFPCVRDSLKESKGSAKVSHVHCAIHYAVAIHFF